MFRRIALSALRLPSVSQLTIRSFSTPTPRSVIPATIQNVQQLVLRSPITLIQATASWCGPCKTFGPILRSTVAKHPHVQLAVFDVDEQPDLAQGLQVQSVPTVFAFINGQFATSFGSIPEQSLEQLLEQLSSKVAPQTTSSESSASTSEQGSSGEADPLVEANEILPVLETIIIGSDVETRDRILSETQRRIQRLESLLAEDSPHPDVLSRRGHLFTALIHLQSRLAFFYLVHDETSFKDASERATATSTMFRSLIQSIQRPPKRGQPRPTLDAALLEELKPAPKPAAPNQQTAPPPASQLNQTMLSFFESSLATVDLLNMASLVLSQQKRLDELIQLEESDKDGLFINFLTFVPPPFLSLVCAIQLALLSFSSDSSLEVTRWLLNPRSSCCVLGTDQRTISSCATSWFICSKSSNRQIQNLLAHPVNAWLRFCFDSFAFLLLLLIVRAQLLLGHVNILILHHGRGDLHQEWA